MYVPLNFEASGEAVLNLLGNPGLADLVSVTANGIMADPVPLYFRPDIGDHGALWGHFSKGNPHCNVERMGQSMAIIRGPDYYVSPNWYVSKSFGGKVVPTWNYLAIHVYGTLVIHHEPSWILELVTLLTESHEQSFTSPWKVRDAPEDFIDSQLSQIVGFELAIEGLEAKAKLSQNRTSMDREGVLRNLELGGRQDLAKLTIESWR